MDVTILLASMAVVCFVVYVVQNFVKRRRFPGGPWGFPIVGYLPMLGPNPQYAFSKLRKKYGDVYSVKMGQWTPVVINGYENLRHILAENSEVTGSRPPFYSFQFNTADRGPGLGFCEYNSRYVTMRKCTIDCMKKVLRNQVGNVQQLALGEAKNLAQFLLDLNGEPSDIASPIGLHVGSCMYETGYGMQGKSFENADFMAYHNYFREFLEFQGTDNIVNLLPWTRFFMQKKLKTFHHIMSLWHRIDAKAQKRHLDTFDENHLRDATDLLILKTRSISQDVKDAVGVTDGDILNCIEELVGAGSDTLPTFLRWGLLYLALNPMVQEKLCQEITEIFGTDGVPVYEKLSEMPYTEATLTEINRISAILPLALPHYTTRVVHIGEYVIPDKTWIIPNLHSANMDECVWEEPNEFRPERFLNGENRINRILAAKVISFGLGKRSCPGEAFARYVCFIFLTVLVQRCKFQSVPGEEYDLKGVYGMSVWPKPHKLVVFARGN